MHTPYRRGEEKSGAPWNTWGAARRGAPFMPRKALDFPQARRDKGEVPQPVDIFSCGFGGGHRLSEEAISAFSWPHRGQAWPQ